MASLAEIPLDADALEVIQGDPVLSAWYQTRLRDGEAGLGWSGFSPRPDRPELFDEQSSFVVNRDPVAFFLAGNACLSGETEIFDPVSKCSRRVDSLRGFTHVWSWNPERLQREIGLAGPAFRKGTATLYRVTLSNGQAFICTAEHRLLSAASGWRPLEDFLGLDLDTSALLAEGENIQILGIEEIGQGDFWDLTVWPYHNYEVAGVFHHNSGKTEAGAYKAARFMLEQQPPPRKDTPFWVCCDTYEQVMAVCWQEKLLGHGYLPESEIEWKRISWHSEKRGYPKAVPLKAWPGRPGKNWQIEFRSYDQGAEAFRARSIGGFWFSEQFPPKVMEETLRGCRNYLYPGGQFAEFTPTDPELCIWLQDKIDKPPPGWRFYRANTACNKDRLADGWFDQFYAFIPDEMVATRMTGELAFFEGAIYQGFSRSVHVTDFGDVFPSDAFHARGLDWGHKHPFYICWAYRTAEPAWYVYDELWSSDQAKITEDYAAEVRRRSEEWGYPREGVQDVRYGPVYCDPSRPGDIAAFGRYGVWAVPAFNDVYRGIDCVRSYIKVQTDAEPRLHIHPRCVRLIESMRRYRWDPKKAQVPKPLKVDDDECDALRYLLYSDSLRPNERPATADYRPATTRHSVRFQPTHESKLGYGFVPGGNRR